MLYSRLNKRDNMKRKQNIDAQQKGLDLNAMKAACQALGFSQESQNDIVRHYEWILTLRLIQMNIPITEHMNKQHLFAKQNYLSALERAIAKHPLKLSDWTRVGRAMQRVYKEASVKTR